MQDVPDPEIMVTFPLIDEPDTALVAWTTTPWTLPSNLALCVNAGFNYVTVITTDNGSCCLNLPLILFTNPCSFIEID